MADYKDLGTIANDPLFQGRCQIALKTQALYVMNNNNPTGQLLGFCQNIMDGTASIYNLTLCILTASALAQEAVLTNAASNPSYNIPDADILSSVSINFNAMAGIPTN